MRAIVGGNKKRDMRTVLGQRRGLLSKIHIAKAQIGMDDEAYRSVLREYFGVETAAALCRKEMERLLELFVGWGWTPKYRGRDPARQVPALCERVQELAEQLAFSSERLRGLARKICDVDRPEWCQDAQKLKRLVAVMEKIKRQEAMGDGR